MEFELKNSKKTLCDRPYKKKGKVLLELESDEFIYDKQLDTTKIPEITTTVVLSGEPENNTNFNWEQVNKLKLFI